MFCHSNERQCNLQVGGGGKLAQVFQDCFYFLKEEVSESEDAE